MSEAITNRMLKARFDLWSEFKRKSGTSQAELDMIRDLVRQDIADGPDRLREEGSKVDDPKIRRGLWYRFFGEVLVSMDALAGEKEEGRVTVHEVVTVLSQAKTEGWRQAYLKYIEDKHGKVFANQVKDAWKRAK